MGSRAGSSQPPGGVTQQSEASASSPAGPTTARSAVLIWPLVKTQLGWIIVGLCIGVLAAAVTAMTAGALAGFVDRGVIEQSEPMGPLLSRLIVLTVVGQVLFFTVLQIYARILFDLEFRLRLWLYERLQGVDPRKLDSVASGQMITRAQTDLNYMQSFVVIIPELVFQSIYLGGFAVWLMMQNAPMTILALAAIPANLYFVNRMRRPLWGMSWLTLNKRAEVTTQFDEAVRGIRVVKAHGREELERRKLDDVATKTYGVSMSRVRLLARYDLAMKAIPVVLSAGMLFLAGRFIASGALTVGTFLVFLRYGRSFAGFAQTLDNYVDRWQYAKTSAARLVELMGGSIGVISRKIQIEAPDRSSVPEGTTGLSMRGVGVSYDGHKVVSGVDLDVQPGELVLVMGGPRSGKSTVAAVACGRQSPDEGHVTLNGTDLAEIDNWALRRDVRWLIEEPFMFGRTVRENLEMGAREATQSVYPRVDEERLRAALRVAGADSVVDELPGGLDEVLGDRALTVSGGQRQRLALARAMVDPPKVLVLDDALLAVNPSLEVEILQRLREHAPDMAILCLTRRDSLATVADRVVRLHGAVQPAPARNGEVVAAAERDGPYDARLTAIIGKLPPDTDKPLVTDDTIATESDRQPTVMNLLQPFWGAVAIAAGVVLALTFAQLFPGLAYREALDAVERESFRTSDILAGALLVVGFAIALLSYAGRITRKRVDESVMYVLRRRMFQRVTRLGVDYYDRELPGYVSARVVNDLDKVSDFMDDGPYTVFSSVILLLATFGVIVVWNPSIALVGAMFIPILFVLSLGQLPIMNRMYRWQRRELGEVLSRLQEDFTGRYLINTYGIDSWSRARFIERGRKLRRAQKWAAVITNSYGQIVGLTLEFAAIAVLWRSGNLVIAGVITAGTLTAIRLYTETALAPIPRIARVLQTYLVARASFRTLREPFKAPILPEESSDVRACPPLEGRILFDHVSFTYPGTARPVLHDVDLEIEPGEVVALVGPTGSGKSSITKLVTRIYDPNDGAVMVDGADLRELDLASYRARVGVVLQDAFCFRGTVAGNVAYGRPDATREEVEQAARDVGAFDVLCGIQGGGFDGVVEEEGRNLTAAQRQMIGLARAWLAGPDMLVLDEATSTLDEALEQSVLEAVRHLGCTTIFVTHRLSVARQADLVVVVGGGKLTEVGEHRKLLKTRGPYAALWAQGDEVADVDIKQRVAGKATRGKTAVATAVGGRGPNGAKAKSRNGAKTPGNGTKPRAAGGRKPKRAT